MLRRTWALLCLASASLGAQDGTLTFELGGAQVRQATITDGDFGRLNAVREVPAAIASARARLADRWWLIGTDVSGTLASRVSAGQAIGLLTVAPSRWWRTDVAHAQTRVGLGEDGTSRTQGVTLRQQLAWPDHVGVWLRADRSTTVRFTRRYAADAVSSALWWRRGPVQLLGGWQRAWTNDEALLLGGEALLGGPGVPRRYDEWSASVLGAAGRVEMQLGVRQRVGLRVTPTGSDRRLVGDARASVRLTPTLSTELSVGTQLADPLRGAPEARVVAWLLRVQRAGRPQVVRWTAVEGGAAVEVRVRGDAPAELTGSFADWAPRAMTREGREWVIRLRLPSGTHRLAIRRAGGEWRAPEGLPRATDDFGGESGVLVIP